MKSPMQREMERKLEDNTKLELAAHEYLRKRLQPLIRSVVRVVQSEAKRRAERAVALSEYSLNTAVYGRNIPDILHHSQPPTTMMVH